MSPQPYKHSRRLSVAGRLKDETPRIAPGGEKPEPPIPASLGGLSSPPAKAAGALPRGPPNSPLGFGP